MIEIDNMIDVVGHGRSSFVMLNELKSYMRGANTLVDMILTHQNGMVWVYPDVKISFESYKNSSTDLNCICNRCYYRNENGEEIWSEVGDSKVDIALMNGFVNLTPAKSIEFKIRQHLEYFDHMMIKYPYNETPYSKTSYIEAIIHDPNNELTRRDLKDLYKGLGVVAIDNDIPVKTSYIGESDHPKADEFDGDNILVAGTSLDVLKSNASRKLIDITQMSSRQKLVLFKYIIDKITLFDRSILDDVAIKITGFNKNIELVNVMFTKVKVQRCNYALPAFNFHGMDVVNGMASNHDCDISSGKFDNKVLLMTIKFDTPTCDITWVFGSHKQTVEIIEKSEVDIDESKNQEETNNT